MGDERGDGVDGDGVDVDGVDVDGVDVDGVDGERTGHRRQRHRFLAPLPRQKDLSSCSLRWCYLRNGHFVSLVSLICLH